jgi:heme-degrading monooxygenase HmoA
MHVRMARMTFSGDAHELAKHAESGLLPIFEEQPGFQAYSVASTGNEIWSLSVWDSAASAEAANSVAAGWVAENMSGEVDIIETKIGELLISTTLGVTA